MKFFKKGLTMTATARIERKEPAKSAITREYIVIKIEGSRKALLSEEIIYSARAKFQCRSVVIAEKRGKKEDQNSFDYLIGLHTKDASKNTYKKRSMGMFSVISNFTLLDSSSKKGIGGWARALCSDEFDIISCSGELDNKKLEHIAMQSKRKKRRFITSVASIKKKDEGCKKPLVFLPPSGWDEGFLFLLIKGIKILFFLLIKGLKSFLFVLIKGLKSCLFLLIKSIIKGLFMIPTYHIIKLTFSFLLFIYFFHYKGGAQITPEMIQQQTLGDIFDWLTDWRNPGLPEKFTRVEKPILSIITDSLAGFVSAVNYLGAFVGKAKLLVTETRGFIAWVSSFRSGS